MSALDPRWIGLVDDGATFPPESRPLAQALSAHVDRRSRPAGCMVGAFVVLDIDLPAALPAAVEHEVTLSIISTGGAGSVVGPLRLASRAGARIAAFETALRDADDLVGNARRLATAVAAARAEGVLADDTPVYVELPLRVSGTAWLAAADVLSEHELGLKFFTGGVAPDDFPTSQLLARWIDAALDRELPFKAAAGLHHAVAHADPWSGLAYHGFLNLLLATRLAFDGAAIAEVIAVLEEHDAPALTERAAAEDLLGARRWFTSFSACSVEEPYDDLVALDLAP